MERKNQPDRSAVGRGRGGVKETGVNHRLDGATAAKAFRDAPTDGEGRRLLYFDGRHWHGLAIVPGMAQVVSIATDGSENVLSACLPVASARRVSRNYNAMCRSGRSVVRGVPLADLAGDPLR
jgi:hypothetical protein